MRRILQFCTDCGTELRREQAAIEAVEGMHYPLMKLADTYFWQIGYEAAPVRTGAEPEVVD